MEKEKEYYYVENAEANINKWGCYWIVLAESENDAIDMAYVDANSLYVGSDGSYRRASNYTGIKKNKLTAVKLSEMVSSGVFCIK